MRPAPGEHQLQEPSAHPSPPRRDRRGPRGGAERGAGALGRAPEAGKSFAGGAPTLAETRRPRLAWEAR